MPLDTPQETQQRLEQLIFRIGSKPGFLTNVESTTIRALLQEYLATKGLSVQSLVKARDESLVKAYNLPHYFNAWLEAEKNKRAAAQRSNAQRSKAAPRNNGPILDLDSALDSAPEPIAANGDSISQEKLESLIESIAIDLINAGFESRKIELSANLKQQIRDLATESAREAIAENLPKTLEIKQINGESLNIGIQHEKFETLLRAASAKLANGFRPNIWLTGPAGSGKTTAAQTVAQCLNLPFAADSSLDADYKIVGFKDAAGQVHKTEFLRVFENGGVYCADEIDNWLPSALLSLNSALANGFISTPAGMVKRHADFICIACANTYGHGATSDYVGRTRLDGASLDRFQPKIDWPIDEKLESSFTTNTRWTQIVQTARRRAKSHGLKILITPRATIAGAALIACGFSYHETVQQTFGAGLDSAQLSNLISGIDLDD